MDRYAMNQLERIERILKAQHEMIAMMFTDEAKAYILQWYNGTVLSENGALKHLKDDDLLRSFIENMSDEQSEDIEDKQIKTDDAKDEYRQPKLK